MSDWYLWCPACDAYWTLPALRGDPPGIRPSLNDKRCPRCKGKLTKAGVLFSSKPTAPLPNRMRSNELMAVLGLGGADGH